VRVRSFKVSKLLAEVNIEHYYFGSCLGRQRWRSEESYTSSYVPMGDGLARSPIGLDRHVMNTVAHDGKWRRQWSLPAIVVAGCALLAVAVGTLRGGRAVSLQMESENAGAALSRTMNVREAQTGQHHANQDATHRSQMLAIQQEKAKLEKKVKQEHLEYVRIALEQRAAQGENEAKRQLAQVLRSENEIEHKKYERFLEREAREEISRSKHWTERQQKLHALRLKRKAQIEISRAKHGTERKQALRALRRPSFLNPLSGGDKSVPVIPKSQTNSHDEESMVRQKLLREEKKVASQIAKLTSPTPQLASKAGARGLGKGASANRLPGVNTGHWFSQTAVVCQCV
jgi:hypothetical protein